MRHLSIIIRLLPVINSTISHYYEEGVRVPHLLPADRLPEWQYDFTRVISPCLVCELAHAAQGVTK